MTTPAPAEFAPYVERWGHPRAEYVLDTAQAPVAAGTVQRWPVTLTGTPWNPVSPGTRRPEIYRVRDLDAPGEIIRVLHTSPAAGQWDVMRGDAGSVPADHAAGAQLAATVCADGLATRAQGVPSGLGLVMDTGITPPFSWADNTEHPVASLAVPAGETADGDALYQAMAFGYVDHPTALGPGTTKGILFGCRWGATNGGNTTWTISRPAAGSGTNQNECRWRLDCWMTLHVNPPSAPAAPRIASNLRVLLGSTEWASTQVAHYFHAIGDQATAWTPGGAANFVLHATIPVAGPVVTMHVLGGRAWRAG